MFGCASTGNLAGSVAAHAARLGLQCYVFIPHDLEPAKILGAAIYRPHVVAVEGNYDDVNRCARRSQIDTAGDSPTSTSGAITPKAPRQWASRLPSSSAGVIPITSCRQWQAARCCPHLQRVARVQRSGPGTGRLPRIHAAQPSGSAPVIRALDAGLEFPEPVKPDTIAKSLAIGNPADGFQVVSGEGDGW